MTTSINKTIITDINNKYKQMNIKINHLNKLGFSNTVIHKTLKTSYQHVNNEIERFKYLKNPREKIDNKLLQKHKDMIK